MASGALALFIGRIVSARGEHQAEDIPDTRLCRACSGGGGKNCGMRLGKLWAPNLTDAALTHDRLP
jgi:hypothetical protein